MKEVIFTHKCEEHNQLVTRSVWLMEFSIENLATLWNKSKSHRILFSDDVNGDFDTFCSIFLTQDIHGNINPNGLLWVVDDFIGVLFMSNIKTHEALLHFSFFDGRLRRDISVKMIDYIFTNYNFERLNAEIVPFASDRVFNFVESIGFQKEGERRKALLYKGERFNIVMYGLLREEFDIKWKKESNNNIKVVR